MNSKCFCTIITGNYLHYALALNESITQFDEEVQLSILVSDSTSLPAVELPKNVSVISYQALCNEGLGKAIQERYHKTYHDAFRWSMKPVLINHLLDTFEKVLYVDCDIQFVNDYHFLFDLLVNSNVLLSPHFRSSDPEVDRTNFILQFNSGLYNGGFIGVNHKAKKVMDWWAKACASICEIDPCKGQFVDQSHLNLVPIFFENVHVIQHRGCNVANWNMIECERSIVGEEVLINKLFPIIFIHFTGSTMRRILNGKDKLLRPHLEKYDERLLRHGLNKSIIASTTTSMNIKPSFFKKLKNKLKTRL